MNRRKSVKFLTSDSATLEELQKLGGSVFSNNHFGMVINGKPTRSDFVKVGEIYQITEPRVIIILEGSGVISIDLEDYHVEKGTVILSRADIIYEMKSCLEDVSVVGIILQKDEDIQDNIVLHTSPEEFERLLRMAYLLWDESQLTPFPLHTVNSLRISMINEIQYIHTIAKKSVVQQAPLRYQELFSQFKRFVRQYFGHERNVPFYADKLHITPHHLSAVIKDVSGQSVMWWVNRATIQQAKVMLKTGNMPVSLVAAQLNFQSASSFNNFFKRETGMTPLEYRNSFL